MTSRFANLAGMQFRSRALVLLASLLLAAACGRKPATIDISPKKSPFSIMPCTRFCPSTTRNKRIFPDCTMYIVVPRSPSVKMRSFPPYLTMKFWNGFVAISCTS